MHDRTPTSSIVRGLMPMAATILIANFACADWPTDPNAPLSLGTVGSIGAGDDHARAVTPDGATWIAWFDGECFGTFKLQRISPGGTLLTPGGLTFFTDDGCTSRDPRMTACADGSVVICAVDGSQNGGGGPLIDTPLQRVAADGQALWGKGLVLPGSTGKIGQLLGLPGGDVLVAWNQGFNVFIARYSPAGVPIWPAPAAIVSPTGSSMRIFGLVSDGADGAFVMWDVPGPYTRAILTARVTAVGAVAWTQPLIVTPPVPASSRHTDPVAVTGSNGEAVVVWTEGAESFETIVGVRLQRISSAGQMLLEPEGRRVSLAATHQFNVCAARNESNGDIYIAWRDGVASQSLRAQRLSSLGDRLWGDTGVAITPFASNSGSHFDARWNVNRLALAVVDVPATPTDPRVRIHRVDSAGAVDAVSWPVSGATTGRVVHANGGPAAGEALVITWFVDPPGFNDLVAAQRINSDGSLGLQPGDITGDGAVNVSDLLAVINHWGPCPVPLTSCVADIHPAPDGNGQVNVSDLLMVINNWGA